jgi:catechol 2,3-dioxygenase-like lactoylglutathione lyase family enzyme
VIRPQAQQAPGKFTPVVDEPNATPTPTIEQLTTTIGYNHVCFAVDDLEAEVRRLVAAGTETRTKVLDFHERKHVFLRGPEGITVELSERYKTGIVVSRTPPN